MRQAAKPAHLQQGASILMLVLALSVTASMISYAFFKEMNHKLKRKQAEEGLVILQEAKESLLFYAASLPELYDNRTIGVGYLPCPDFTGSGRPADNCNTSSTTMVGRLPHQIMTPMYYLFSYFANPELGDYGGASSIWYAVTGADSLAVDFRFKQAGGSPNLKTPLNTNLVLKTLAQPEGDPTPTADFYDIVCAEDGVVCLDGQPVVAVLALAGAPLERQTRNAAKRWDYKEHLESNKTNAHAFSSAFSGTCDYDDFRQCFNDKVIAITLKEWVQAMEQRVRIDSGIFALCDYDVPERHYDEARAKDLKNTPNFLTTDDWLAKNEWQKVSDICNLDE